MRTEGTVETAVLAPSRRSIARTGIGGVEGVRESLSCAACAICLTQRIEAGKPLDSWGASTRQRSTPRAPEWMGDTGEKGLAEGRASWSLPLRPRGRQATTTKHSQPRRDRRQRRGASPPMDAGNPAGETSRRNAAGRGESVATRPSSHQLAAVPLVVALRERSPAQLEGDLPAGDEHRHRHARERRFDAQGRDLDDVAVAIGRHGGVHRARIEREHRGAQAADENEDAAHEGSGRSSDGCIVARPPHSRRTNGRTTSDKRATRARPRCAQTSLRMKMRACPGGRSRTRRAVRSRPGRFTQLWRLSIMKKYATLLAGVLAAMTLHCRPSRPTMRPRPR